MLMFYKFILATSLFVLCSCAQVSQNPDPQHNPNTVSSGPEHDTWGRGSDPWISDWERAQKKQAQIAKDIHRAQKPKAG
mgnify:CR=1 FL=1